MVQMALARLAEEGIPVSDSLRSTLAGRKGILTSLPDPKAVREPFAAHARVTYTTALGLEGDTDPYFRGFDMTYPDFWRVREWQRVHN